MLFKNPEQKKSFFTSNTCYNSGHTRRMIKAPDKEEINQLAPPTVQGIWTLPKQSQGEKSYVFFLGSNNWKFIPELLTPSLS